MSAGNRAGGAPDVRGARALLFVCLGNICRSPLAQGVFEHLAERRGVRPLLTIESRGTGGWHVGQPPDPRAAEVAGRNGVCLRSVGKQLDPGRDFNRFDLLLAMDRSNLKNLLAAGCPPEKAHLFMTFAGIRAGGVIEVPDPYYGGPEGFDRVYELVHAGVEGLLDAIL